VDVCVDEIWSTGLNLSQNHKSDVRLGIFRRNQAIRVEDFLLLELVLDYWLYLKLVLLVCVICRLVKAY